MQRLLLSGLAALAAALPLASQADAMDYSYAEIGYVDTELDGDGSTWTATASSCAARWRCIQNFFVFAGYQDLSFDFGIDASLLEVGGGGHWPLTDRST